MHEHNESPASLRGLRWSLPVSTRPPQEPRSIPMTRTTLTYEVCLARHQEARGANRSSSVTPASEDFLHELAGFRSLRLGWIRLEALIRTPSTEHGLRSSKLARHRVVFPGP